MTAVVSPTCDCSSAVVEAETEMANCMRSVTPDLFTPLHVTFDFCDRRQFVTVSRFKMEFKVEEIANK